MLLLFLQYFSSNKCSFCKHETSFKNIYKSYGPEAFEWHSIRNQNADKKQDLLFLKYIFMKSEVWKETKMALFLPFRSAVSVLSVDPRVSSCRGQ